MTRSSTPANALEWANKIWTVSLENSPRFWTATEKLLQSLLSNEGELVDPDNAESTVSALGMKFKQVVELFVRAQPILDYLLVELQKKTNMEGPPSAHHSIHVSQMYKQPPQVGNTVRTSRLLSQLQFTSQTAKSRLHFTGWKKLPSFSNSPSKLMPFSDVTNQMNMATLSLPRQSSDKLWTTTFTSTKTSPPCSPVLNKFPFPVLPPHCFSGIMRKAQR